MKRNNARIALPGECTCSQLTVHPANWNHSGANYKTQWYISYRFYSADGQVKQVINRRMNNAQTLADKRILTKALLDAELRILLKGYNPILGKVVAPENISDISPETSFIEALHGALDRLKISANHRSNIGSTLKVVAKAAHRLQIDLLEIRLIRRRHIRLILDECEKIKDTWTPNMFNNFRKELSSLFTELAELEVVEYNPVKDIKKQKVVHRIREVLSQKERIQINKRLKEENRRFWLFIHMFFHSGARITEFCRLRLSDISIDRQQVKYLILKGREMKEVIRPIKDIALPYWKEYLEGFDGMEYLISKGLQPGMTPFRPEQITRRWRRWVKEKMNIKCDFYALKHLNSDETAALQGIEAAALQNAHTSVSTTKIYYAINEQVREM